MYGQTYDEKKFFLLKEYMNRYDDIFRWKIVSDSYDYGKYTFN